MAKQIKKTDLVEDDIFSSIRDSALKTITVIEKINAEFIQTSKSLKESIGGAKFSNSKSIDEFTKAVSAAQKVQAQSLKLDQEKLKVNQQLSKSEEMLAKSTQAKSKADQESLKTSQQKEVLAQQEEKTKQQTLRTAQQQAAADEKTARAAAKAKKAAEDENNAYKQLEVNTRKLKNESKDYAAQLRALEVAGQKNSKQWYALDKAYRQTTKAAQDGDAALKKIDSTVGDNFRNVGNYKDAINKLRSGLGQLGLAFGIGSVVQGAGKTIIEFDQKIADLVAITGASGKDLEFFKTQAIELGKGVEGGASQVIEAYKLIASAKPELLENATALDAVTQSAITLSQASGLELTDAATRLTDAMNQFGAPAEEAGKFIDVLANGALFGAAEIPQVTDALLKFGAVAKTANVSIEESTALIEALASKGLKGADAGTALRNVMLKLSAPDALPKEAKDMMDKLGISFETISNTSLPFAKRLEAMKPLLKDNAAMVKVFGLENTVAATNLIGMTGEIEDLTSKMDKQGTATEQAEARTNTLSFALNELKETWNALVLEFANGEGSSQLLINGLRFIAENLGTILKWVGKGVVAWASYRTILAAVQAKNFLMNGGLKNTVTGLMDIFKNTKKAGEGAQEMGEGMTKAGNSMKAVPWMAIIGAVIELATALYDVATGADVAQAKMEAFERYKKGAAAENAKFISGISDEIEANSKMLELKVAQGKMTEENANKERLAFLQSKQFFQEVTNFQTRQTTTEYFNIFGKIANQVEEINRNIKLAEASIKSYEADDAFKNRLKIGEEKGKIKALKESRGALWEYNKVLQDEVHNLRVLEAQAKTTEKANTSYTKTQAKQATGIKNVNVELEKQNEYLSEQTELLNALDEIYRNREIDALNVKIEQETATQSQSASDTGQFSTNELAQMIYERTELEKKAIDERLKYDLEALDIKSQAEIQKARESLAAAYLKASTASGISTEDKIQLQADYQAALEQLEMDELQRAADLELKKKALTEKSVDDKLKLETDAAKETGEKIDEIFNRALTRMEDNEKKSDERRIERAKTQREMIDMLADYFIKKSNEKIAQIDKEIAAAEQQADTLRQLAINGNITAKESLAEQQRLIVEANRKKEAELKKQERIKLAQSVYQAYSSKVEAGSKNPLVDTIKDITLLNQFISSLPTFYEGTETTVGAALGAPQLSGRDGHIVRVDGSEKILNPKLSAMTGDLTTSEIARIANEYNNGKLMSKGDGAVQISTGWNSSEVLKKLDEIGRVISDKPEMNIEVGQIVQGAMDIIHSTKKGNTIIYNKYRVKG